MALLLLLGLILLSSYYSLADPPRCFDHENRPISWYIAYKMPKIENSTDPEVAEGVALYLMDGYKWMRVGNVTGTVNNPIHNTFQQFPVRDQDPSLLYLAYNDEPPDREYSTTRGHAKGVFSADRDGGMWMVHSVPKFPSLRNSTSYPDYPKSGTVYGQMFMCISLPYRSINETIAQIELRYVFDYELYFPSYMILAFPQLQKIILGIEETDPNPLISTILTSSSRYFYSFGKTAAYNADIYSFVANTFFFDLYVESWRHENQSLPSNCTLWRRNVQNVEKITMEPNVTFTSYHDHSKFAVTSIGHVVCVGDINRSRTQFTRAGGTVCFQDLYVGRAFTNIIDKVDECPEKPEPRRPITQADRDVTWINDEDFPNNRLNN